MEDLSLHILDIAENSVRAGATEVTVSIRRDDDQGDLLVKIKDNGRGLTEVEVEKVFDPFFTRRTERRVGLGLPLLAQAAEETGGEVSITSKPGIGTELTARFCLGHIDIRPLGDIGSTIIALISGYPQVDFNFEYVANSEDFTLSTAQVKSQLQDVSIAEPAVLKFLRESIAEGILDIDRRT